MKKVYVLLKGFTQATGTYIYKQYVKGRTQVRTNSILSVENNLDIASHRSVAFLYLTARTGCHEVMLADMYTFFTVSLAKVLRF